MVLDAKSGWPAPGRSGDPELVAELCAESPRFAELWFAHEIAIQRSSVTRRHHPAMGPLELDAQALGVSCVDQRLVFYAAAPGTSAQEPLHLLRVVGVQDLRPTD